MYPALKSKAIRHIGDVVYTTTNQVIVLGNNDDDSKGINANKIIGSPNPRFTAEIFDELLDEKIISVDNRRVSNMGSTYYEHVNLTGRGWEIYKEQKPWRRFFLKPIKAARRGVPWAVMLKFLLG